MSDKTKTEILEDLDDVLAENEDLKTENEKLVIANKELRRDLKKAQTSSVSTGRRHVTSREL
jgi:cell division septum initiation protein DivIVA